MTQFIALDGSENTQDLRISLHTKHYGFAKSLNALPVTQSEFELACKHYPIVFIAANAEETVLQPVALLSLTPNDNWFVHADQSWEPYHYIPAFAKKHPFQLGVDESQQRYVVYVDGSYSGLSTGTEAVEDSMAFFENGEPTPYLEQLSQALRTLHMELEQTQLWVMRLKEKGLLLQRTITTTVGEQSEQLAGVWVVDTDKLDELDDTELAQMYHNGTLALIEQHRLSLSNLDLLAQRATL